MKVRFHVPEARDPLREGGISVDMAPARRPDVPHWRWYLLVALLALPLAWLLGRFLLAAFTLSGPGYLSYASLELRAPLAAQIEAVAVQEGQQLIAGGELLHLQPLPDAGDGREAALGGITLTLPAAALPGSTAADPASASALRPAGRFTTSADAMPASFSAATASAAAGLALAAPARSLVERVWVQPGEVVLVGSPLLTLRMGDTPVVHAWLDSRHLGRLYPGRPASVRLPDGIRLPATVARVAPRTELPPPELEGAPANGRDLRVTLQLEEQPAPAQRVNRLPVEVRLRWRDELPWRRPGAD